VLVETLNTAQSISQSPGQSVLVGSWVKDSDPIPSPLCNMHVLRSDCPEWRQRVTPRQVTSRHYVNRPNASACIIDITANRPVWLE